MIRNETSARDPMSAIARILEQLDDTDHIAAKISDSEAALVSYGLAMNLVHLAAGAMHLNKSEMGFATMPLLRSMMEFAIYLRWLADDPDGAVTAMNQQLQRNQASLLERLDAAGIEPSAEARAVAEQTIADLRVPPAKGRIPNVEGAMIRYRLHGAYAVWTGVSRLAHPTVTAARQFFVESQEGIDLRTQPADTTDIDVPMVCLLALWDAAWYLNVFLDGAPWSAELIAVSEEFEFNHAESNDSGHDPSDRDQGNE